MGFGLNELGEQAFLSYLPGTPQDRVADCVAFKAQENGSTWGRYPGRGAMVVCAGAHDERGQRGAAAARRNQRDHGASGADGGASGGQHGGLSMFELHNPLDTPVTLMSEAGPWRIDGGIQYTFPSNTVLAAHSYLLLVSFDPADAVAWIRSCARMA